VNNSDDASLASLGRMLMRGLVPALIVASAGAAVVFVVSGTMQPSYQATATVLASNASASIGRFDITLASPPAIDLAAYRSVVLSRPILERARTIVDDPGVLEDARITVTAEVMNISSFIRIHARAPDPAVAASAANAMAYALVEWDRQRSTDNLTRIIQALEQQVDAISEQVALLQASPDAAPDQIEGQIRLRAERQQELAYARALSASAVGMLDIVEPAVAPLVPVAPRPRSYALIAFLALTFIGFGIYLLWQALDTRIRTATDVARATGYPLLAEFTGGGNPNQVDREAIGYLRANVDFAVDGHDPIVIMVTSPVETTGKARVSHGVATSFADDGSRTLLIDADFANPTLSQALRIDPAEVAPLRAYLERTPAGMAPATSTLRSGSTVDVIPNDDVVGTASDLLRRGFGRALETWNDQYDVIVVDTTPLLHAADAVSIVRSVTGLILVVDVGSATRAQLRRTVDLIERSGAWVLGVVVVHDGTDIRLTANMPFRVGGTSDRNAGGAVRHRVQRG
jgi:capsular exopolysaccharide synthesis family protein